jgi:signal transduction histidine kinase
MIKLCEEGEIVMIGTPAKIWLGVPLTIEQKVIGAIVVQSYDNQNAYTEKDKQVLEFISSQISISIERKIADHEIKAALVKAQESDRLKSSFLANMSHEIRTPLNSIIGFSDLLCDPGFESEQHYQFAKIINSSGNSLLSIISDIMDISKIEAGQINLEKKGFNVLQLIRNVQKEQSFSALEKGIELRLDPANPKTDIWINSDENRLKQVLHNLVGNAFKFTEKGYVELGFAIQGNCVQFHVSDTGIGIPKEFHDKIFERFRQVESSFSRKHGGNGLGLAISKSLVELLGGQVWIESEQGKGSTFYFTIPIGK